MIKERFKLCTDPKHLAWVSWTLLANNPVNKTTYLLFCAADLLVILFYSFILIQRVHFSNFDMTSVTDATSYGSNTSGQMFDLTLKSFENEKDYLGNGIQLTFMRKLDYQLNSLIRENSDVLFMCTVAIVGSLLFILMILLIMGTMIKNHANLEKQSIMKKGFTLLLVSFLTFLHMPLFDVIIRTIIATFEGTTEISLLIIRYSICALAVILFVLFMIFLVRIFNVCVPTELIPWCAPISKLVFLNLFIKAGLVISNAFDINGTYAVPEIIFFFFLQGFQACYRVLFAPNYIKEIDLFVKTKDFAVCLVFFIGIICKVLNDRTNYDGVYFIIFIPIVTVAWIMFEVYRKQIILLKVKTKSLKLEVENEFALYVMMTLVRDCLSDTVASQKVFGQLMDLMLTHIEDCDDQLCICDEMENFYELLRLKQLHNQEVFPLMRSERKRYKKIIDDQGLIGTVSNITDVTLKTNSTESTVQRDNNNQNGGLDRHAEDEERQDAMGISQQDQEDQIKKLTVEQQVAKKKRNSTVYKINIDETKHRFLSELLYLFYFEMIKKFPDSFKIQLLSNYFALLYKQKEMLCVFQMRSFNKAKLSKLDQCCHQINEQYLLYEIQKIQKMNSHVSSNIQEGNFNGDYFIKMNQLYRELNITIEFLSASVVSFWKIFERPSIDVEATQIIGTDISKNIQNVFKTFNDLDTLKIFKDYQMYFQFAIVQLHILNDPVAYELYIGKMKSILEINKVYQKNFSQSGSANSDQANFIIVDANGTKFGSIIQVNNSLRMLLGWTEEDFKRFRIENFMPQLIREKHPEFMNRYNKTGQSYIINNKCTMFIKKANGYVIPVELYIKFHYSIDYQYTFLAIMKPFYEMAPFSNGVKYNISQLIFLIVDDEEEGRITEFSESCSKLLSTYGFGAELQQNGIIKRITDIVIDFDFQNLQKTRQERYMTNDIYENVLRLDLNQFDDSNSMSHDHNKKTGNLLQSLLVNNGGLISAKTRIFEERYSGGVLDMNIFCFAFINDNDGNGSVIKNESIGSKQITVVAASKDNHDAQLQHEDSLIDHDQSQSATGSSSSMRDSTSSMAEFRNFHSFTEQVTPKTLTLIIKLIVALYVIMMTIASVNLGINITRQMQSESDVHTVRQAFDRINWISMNQLLVRVLLNIANGYEPENSYLIDDRFNKYIQLQEDRVQQLKNTQSLLQLSNFLSTPEFKRFQEDKIVPLYYLSESNQVYTKYESLNIAFNLYIAKLTEMNSFKKQQLKGNLQVQNLESRLDKNYKPTYYEQSIFFIVQNGNKELRQFAIDACTFYGRESEQHAEQNITQTKVTAIISIIIIVIIGLIIAPILTTAEIRKYKALLYFLKIPRDKLPDLIKNCEYCLNMNDEDRYYQIMRDYEDFLGIKLVNQQVDQLRQARDQQNNIDNQASKNDDGSAPRSSTGIDSAIYAKNSTAELQSNDASLAFGGNESLQSVDNFGPRNSRRQHLRRDSNNNVTASKDGKIADGLSKVIGSSIGGSVSEVREEEEEDDMMDHNNERDRDNDMDQKDDVINNNKFVLENLNLKGNRNDDKKKKLQEDMTQQEIDDDNQDQSDFANKSKQINARAYKRRSVMVFSSLTIILILSTYFLIAYFLAMKTFETASLVIESLEGIFYKGTCFDSAMNFLRESEIRNESMIIKSTLNTQSEKLDAISFSATDYYLDFCYAKEDQYNRMRVAFPPFFEKAKGYIDAMESANMCEHIYTGEFAHLKDVCSSSLNGILNKGLTNAFYYMFTQILKTNLYFNALGATSIRNTTILKGMMDDIAMVQIIDMKATILDPALNQLKQQCMQSVIDYIQMLLNNFITAFGVFIAILTFAVLVLILIGFRILRKSMWDTNIILKIIPFETLPKQDRIDIKDFFNS